MSSDAGPDVRWVGNEAGLAFETSWYGRDRRATYPGDPNYARNLARGQADASDWVLPEVDVSSRVTAFGFFAATLTPIIIANSVCETPSFARTAQANR